jgi:hypothetical protein
MVGGFFDRFPPVDFFGKSLPGILFLFLILSSLPPNIIEKVGGENIKVNGISGVLLIIFLLLVFGFTLGQVLNTISVVIEKGFYWMGRQLYVLYHTPDSTPDHEWFTQRLTGPDTEKRIRRGTRLWLWNRFIGFKLIFTPHRYLFYLRIKRNLNPEKPYDDKDIIEVFQKEFERVFEQGPNIPNYDNLQKDDKRGGELTTEVYPLTMSKLDTKNINRARKFKAKYMFSRSIWVVLLGFAFVHTYFVLSSTSSNILLFSIFPYNSVLIPALLLISAVAFMYASGEYKHYFVQYIFSDFIASASWDI